GEHVLRLRDAWKLLGSRQAAGDLPLDQVRLREQVGEEPEAGDDGRGPEVVWLVSDELDLERLTGLGASDVDGAGQRMAEPEVQAAGVGVRAVACELPVEAVPSLERDGLLRLDRRHWLQAGVP